MRRILLVEDHAWFRQALASLLATEHEGFLAEQAGSFFEARRLLRIKGRYDAMVVDLGLPDGDGVRIVRGLREAVPSGAMVVLTISVDSRKIDEAFEAGADEVLSKVTPLREIVATLGRLVAP